MRRRQRAGKPSGKRRAGAVAALAALAIVVAGSMAGAAVRAAQTGGSDGGASAPAEQPAESAASSEETATSSGDAGEQEGQEPQSQVLSVLRSHTWQARDDASRTVRFRDGSFVESDGTTTKVSAFEADDEQWDGTAGSLTCRITADGSAQPASSVITLSGSEGSYQVACDGFALSKSYVQGSKGEGPVAVSGVTEPYTTLIDGKTPELTSAIASWCRDHAPTATSATFDGEVYVDVPAKRVTATFTCDDAAATVISVVYSGGAFEVKG
ncbi:MAG: hypothetical protein ACOX12_01715 [Eggerthellaceae bacterium]|jgi:hypothetical protein